MYIIERVVTSRYSEYRKIVICTAENAEIAQQVVEMLYIQKELASRVPCPPDGSVRSWEKYWTDVKSILEIDTLVNPTSEYVKYHAFESNRHFTNITKD